MFHQKYVSPFSGGVLEGDDESKRVTVSCYIIPTVYILYREEAALTFYPLLRLSVLLSTRCSSFQNQYLEDISMSCLSIFYVDDRS